MSTNDSFIAYPKTTPVPTVITFDVLTAVTQFYNAPILKKVDINFRGNQSTTLASLLSNKIIQARLLLVNTASSSGIMAYRVDGTIIYPDFVNGSYTTSGKTYSINEYLFSFYLNNGVVACTLDLNAYAPGSSQKGATAISKR